MSTFIITGRRSVPFLSVSLSICVFLYHFVSVSPIWTGRRSVPFLILSLWFSISLSISVFLSSLSIALLCCFFCYFEEANLTRLFLFLFLPISLYLYLYLSERRGIVAWWERRPRSAFMMRRARLSVNSWPMTLKGKLSLDTYSDARSIIYL